MYIFLFFFFFNFMLYEASEKLALMQVSCIFWGGKVPSISENPDCWVINLELYQNSPSKASQVQSPSPGPHQEFIEAMTELSITVSLLSISAFLIRLSWIIRGLFILIDTYWIRGKRVWRLRNKSWILSSSFCTVESQTKQGEEMLRRFVQRTPVIPYGKGAFSEECISLLIFQDLRQSLLLFFSFCHICWHFLHWWCGWGNGLLHLFLRFIPESLLLKNLFICLLMLSLETLENVSAETNNN